MTQAMRNGLDVDKRLLVALREGTGTVLQYSPKIMHAQEVAQEVLAPQEAGSRRKTVLFLRFTSMNIRNARSGKSNRKKPQELMTEQL